MGKNQPMAGACRNRSGQEISLTSLLDLPIHEQNYWIWYSILAATIKDSSRYRSIKSNKLYVVLPLSSESEGGIYLGSYLQYPRIYMPSDEQLGEEFSWRKKLSKSQKDGEEFSSLVDLKISKLMDILERLSNYQDAFLRYASYEDEFFESEWRYFKEDLYIGLVTYSSHLERRLRKYQYQKAPLFLQLEVAYELRDIKKIIQFVSRHK